MSFGAGSTGQGCVENPLSVWSVEVVPGTDTKKCFCVLRGERTKSAP